MEKSYDYINNVTWETGRQGEMRAVGLPEITVATPPEFKQGVEGVWSPEQFIVASVNSCLMTTFLAIAENSKLDFESYSSDATGTMEKVDGRFMFSKFVVKPKIVVKEEKDIERAERIAHKAEEHCLISHSLKSEVILEPEVSLK